MFMKSGVMMYKQGRGRTGACSVLIVVLVTGLLLGGASVASASGYTHCLKCHVKKPDLKRKHVHPAVEMGCTVCHTEAHEKKAANPLGLSSSPPKLCFNCHNSGQFKKKTVHPPVAAGMCTFCHNPHSSDNSHLLRAKVPALCYKCHGKFNKKVVHPPVAAGECLLCHTPHAGPYRDLLLKPLDALCLQCHAQVEKFRHVLTFGKGHPLFIKNNPKDPGHEFTCLNCHNPHDSDWMILFKYKVTDPDGFQLCSHCHNM